MSIDAALMQMLARMDRLEQMVGRLGLGEVFRAATSYTTGWGGTGAGSPVLLGADTTSLTIGGGRVLVLFACTIRSTVADTLMGVAVQVDGTTNLTGVGNTQSTPADRAQASIVVATIALTAGAHTFRPFITFNAGTNTVDNNGILVLAELPAS